MTENCMDDFDLEILYEIMEEKLSDETLSLIYERIVNKK